MRSFFASRGVLEVETPLLGRATVTDPHIQSLRVGQRYLQTSPEYAMKRLLAAGIGPIYQICKSFRAEESGARHSREFTMLEWYRPGFDHRLLMDEVEQLLTEVAGAPRARRVSFGELFSGHVGLDPHATSVSELERAWGDLGLPPVASGGLRRSDWLNLLMSEWIEPKLAGGTPTFVYDYPVDLSALARIRREGGVSVAERFEVYFGGLELANGYHELTDAVEQRQRFERDLELRRELGLPPVAIDESLLSALEKGLPPCAGVALGVDRLLMACSGAGSIDEVRALPEEVWE